MGSLKLYSGRVGVAGLNKAKNPTIKRELMHNMLTIVVV